MQFTECNFLLLNFTIDLFWLDTEQIYDSSKRNHYKELSSCRIKKKLIILEFILLQ